MSSSMVDLEAARVLIDAKTVHFSGRPATALRAIADYLDHHPYLMFLAVTATLDYDGDGMADMNWYVTVEDTTPYAERRRSREGGRDR